MTFETVREVALALPEIEEGTSYGTPAFKVRRRFLCRLREEGGFPSSSPRSTLAPSPLRGRVGEGGTG